MLRAWLLAVSLSAVLAEFRCNGVCAPAYSIRTTNQNVLRGNILSNAYNKDVVPLPNSGPTIVSMTINFFSNRYIGLSNGKLEMRVWFDLYWEDTRLRWNPSDFGGIDKITVDTDVVAGTNEIWVPDVAPLNMDLPLSSTLSSERATVFNNGTVVWSRPGFYSADCLFDDIVQFPWDYPKCTVEFGSWGYDSDELVLAFFGRGWTFGGLDSSDFFDRTNREFKIHRVDQEKQTYASRGFRTNWSVLKYTVQLQRQTRLTYVAKSILPHVLLTGCAFSALLMNPECYERLTLGISLVFVELLSQVLFATKISLTSRWTALDKITSSALFLTMVAFFESCIVCALYWQARTVRPRPTSKSGIKAKLKNMFHIPPKASQPHELPVMLRRQSSQAKIHSQDDDIQMPEFSKASEKQKKEIKFMIKERKIQCRIEEETIRLQEHRYRFIASRIDLAGLLSMPTAFFIVLFVILAEVTYLVNSVDSSNITEDVVLGFVTPASSASTISLFCVLLGTILTTAFALQA
eukprot:c45792_g1_i1.p1 GENE.c45792_g1_i1~~c45792_g1_i1.p1  ORF type:complete len:520 (+),score=65.08 c45792_g1_i1:47-1606(+)